MAVQARGPRDDIRFSSHEDDGQGMSLLGLSNFTKWKQEAISRLILNENLMKLMYYNTPDALSKPTPTEEQISRMVSPGKDQQIFQYRYAGNLATRQTSYI